MKEIDEDYFKVGEIVTFEVENNADYQHPIWNYENQTCDHTGIYVTATVVEVEPTRIITKHITKHKTHKSTKWGWPNVKSDKYHPDQWKREGYLQKIEELLEEKTKTCTCDLSIMMNRGCQCGGK